MKYIGKSISMERREPGRIGEIMPQMLKALHLDRGMNMHLIFSAWDEVTGAGQYTLNRYFRNGTLYCGLSSSVVRNQLSFNRNGIIEAMNRKIVENPLFSAGGDMSPVKSLVLR